MNHRWILFIPVIAALCCADSASAQDYQSIERNAFILQKLAGSIEGYADALGGELIDYPRMRDDRPFALITRATNGIHAIEWKSAPVTGTSDSDNISFVVHAGILTRPNASFGFALFVNDTARVAFSTVDTVSWEAGVSGGIRLAFYGALRDQHTDAFGFLQILVPKRFVTPGESVRFRAVGDSAGSRVWFMVFRDDDVLTYLAERVASESACEISFDERGKEYHGTLSAPTTWLNKKAAYSFAESPVTPLSLVIQNDTAVASFAIPARKQSSFRLYCDGEKVVEAPGLFRDISQSALFPKKIVSLKSHSLPSGGWALEHKSIYAPQVSPAFTMLSAASRKSDTLHLIISTHQDIAWMDSPEQCVKDRDEKILAPALDVMKSDPQYRFDLEDVLFLREFLERHPDRKGELQKVIASGQLGIGASFNQPYEDLSSGEMLVRQFYAGRKWLRKNFPGCDSRTYWNPDVPGRSAQMPQIMSKAGVKYLFMSRFGKGLYRWLSPDSSGVLAMSPGHYADFAERVGRKGFPEMAGFIANFSREWSGEIFNGSATVPVISMTDMSTPVRYGDLIDTWNGVSSISLPQGASQLLSLPFIRYSTAEQFFNGVAAEKPVIPSVFGERPNIWLYIHGPTHHRAVSAKREADFYLPAAETFSTVDALLAKSFARYPQHELTTAWESQLYPDHGWGGKNGDITDSTFRANYEEARDTGKRIYRSAAGAIAARVQTSPGKGLPVVLFNSLSWRRTAPVHLSVTVAPGEFRQGFVLYNASGRIIPSQTSTITRYPDGSVNSAEIVFVAEDLPPVGYSTLYIRRSPRIVAADTSSAMIETLENRYYVISLAPGGVRQIYDINLKMELLSTEKFLGGELFTMQSAGEDAGEWSEPQQPTMEGFEKLSNYNPGWRLIESGTVRQVAELRQEINHVTVVQRVVLYSALKQIDFETDLLKWDGTKYREFRLAFPLKMEQGRIAYEIPFGALEVGKDEMKGNAGERYLKEVSTLRPRSIQNWINASDNEVSVTFSSSVAVWDYQDPTDQSMTSPLLQPILLTSRKSCHGLGPWYLQEGDHAYRFSMTSHRPDWRNGRKFGVAANAPIMVVFNPRPSGPPTLPEAKSFFSLAANNIVLSTMKKCEDDDAVVLRFYEDAGMNGAAKVRFMTLLQSVQNTNIIEEDGRAVPFKSDEISLKLQHHSIETFKVVPRFR
ncbi:MAG TPA: alpha-mannosidase [Bacteroidetes bacterium]|nr:alpha-mannosidase [Bacteroidota bacterium]